MWDRPRLLNWISSVLFGISFGALIYVGFLSIFNASIFPLKEVKVLGDLQHVKQQQLELVVNKTLQGGFFLVNLRYAHDAFEHLDWVESASVRRRWPDRIEVVINEHQPLAKWGKQKMVSQKGHVFNAMLAKPLPAFVGPDNSAEQVTMQYAAFSEILKPVQMKIVKLALTDRNAWQIETDKGMTIELGRTDVNKRMERFVAVYRSTIAELNKKISYVDLRYTNGFAIRKPNES